MNEQAQQCDDCPASSLSYRLWRWFHKGRTGLRCFACGDKMPGLYLPAIRPTPEIEPHRALQQRRLLPDNLPHVGA